MLAAAGHGTGNTLAHASHGTAKAVAAGSRAPDHLPRLPAGVPTHRAP